MSTQTENQKSKAQIKRDAEEGARAKVARRIEELMKARTEMLDERQALTVKASEAIAPIQKEYGDKLKPITTLYEGKISPLTENIHAAEKEILALCYDEEKQKVLHRLLFDVGGNWRFEDMLQYLHIKHTGEVIEKKGFDLSKFVKKFRDYVKVTYNIKDLTTLLTDADMRRKSGIDKFNIDLKYIESIEFKIKKEKSNEQDEQQK